MKGNEGISEDPPLRDEELTLLRAGVLMTRNGRPSGPLEKILVVNHKAPSKLATKVKLPKRHRPLPIPHGAQKEDPNSYGYGLFYVEPYTSERSKLFDNHVPDLSIHPQNDDPIHDNIQRMPQFEKERTAGNRWLLSNLACGPLSSLPELIRLPCSRLPGFKRSILSSRLEDCSTSRLVLAKDPKTPHIPAKPKTSSVRIKTANPESIPKDLLDPFYTLRFKETNILSEPLPQHEAKHSERVSRIDCRSPDGRDIDDGHSNEKGQHDPMAAVQKLNKKPTLQFPPLPCSIPPHKVRSPRMEKWSLSNPPHQLPWKQDVEWAMRSYPYDALS
ncbi:hypothetical protein HDU97_006393 [Phlyctochytrium planicorne]|nr:hypothetical protein HDU97_006393 [Phlyctochytrium planicorne]